MPALIRRPSLITTTIALDRLVASGRDVRTRVDEQADAELKADIAARRLLRPHTDQLLDRYSEHKAKQIAIDPALDLSGIAVCKR